MISARRGGGLGPARRLALARTLVMLLAAGPQLALADPAAPTSTTDSAAAPEARANEPFRDGVRRYQEGDLQGAAAAFALAYEQSHDFRLLYNLAQVQEDLHDYAQALRSLERYLALGSAPGNVPPIAAERREEVARTQAQLAQRAASLRVTANVAGAQLWLDGVPAGGLPSEPTWLNPGAHHLLVRHEGRAPTLQTLVLQPGEQRVIDVALRAPPPGLAPSAPGGVDASEPANRTPLWIGLGATGASAALAVGFALLTRNADARLERELSNYPADAEALDAARSRVATLAAVTDVCIGASIVAAGLSLYFALGPADGDDALLGNVQLEIAPGSSSVAFESTF
jgi:tetratricopeptide (TPR) repeat protein